MLKLALAGIVALGLVSSAVAGPWEDGIAAYGSGDYAKALDLWKPLAEKGDARAQNNLGVIYEKGLGVAQDYAEAVLWYRRSADQGNEQAKKNLADLSAGQLTPEAPSKSEFTLVGEERWVALASRQTLAEAVELAKRYAVEKARVFRAKNGWFAVVLGPHATTDIGAFRKTYVGQELPRDAFLTQGMGYVETVWPAPPQVAAILTPPPIEAPKQPDAPQQFAAPSPTLAPTEPSVPKAPPPRSVPAPLGKGAAINVRKLKPGTPDELTIITVEGELLFGDDLRFADAAISTPKALVALSSPGGSLDAGIAIGKAIRLKGFATLVPKGFSCASACALAWLGGAPRLMAEGTTIGFHAAYRIDNGNVDSFANALMGAYLSQLGLPYAAIKYISEPQPADMRWLTFPDAERIGIEVKPFPAKQ